MKISKGVIILEKRQVIHVVDLVAFAVDMVVQRKGVGIMTKVPRLIALSMCNA